MNPTTIPSELAERRQWVVWRFEERDGKRTKVPMQPGTPARRASSTDPATWSDHAAAVHAAQHGDGIGYVFSVDDPFAGVDLDHCVTDGKLHPAAAKIVERLDSYTEVSPSGRGVHVLVRACVNGGPSRTSATPWGSCFENYDHGRFFCVSGAHVAGTPGTINERQDQLDRIRAELFPPPPKRAPQREPTAPATLDDRELLDRARAARNGAQFEALWQGDASGYGGDQSAADLALAGMIAFWTGPDPARIDALFRQSGLMRGKWDSPRGDGTYGRQTIDKALSGRSEFYGDRSRASREIADRSTPVLECTFDKKNKMHLPPVPAHDDTAGQLAWLTCVLNLHPAHPITSGAWQGQLGPDGHIALRRAGAPDLRIEPARAMNKPASLIDTLTGRRHATDGMLHAYTTLHCREIAHVIECLCDNADALTDEQEARGVIGTFLQIATAVEGCTTYGTPAQRFEAARGLRREIDSQTGRPFGPPRYLLDTDNTGERIDADTGEIIDEGAPVEYVIAVSDLADAARQHFGTSLPRGWLDARMDAISWRRITIDGHATAGRAGRQGAHATVLAYRGHLSHEQDRQA